MLAMLRTEKASPGCRPRVTDGHTRESEQANTMYCSMQPIHGRQRKRRRIINNSRPLECVYMHTLPILEGKKKAATLDLTTFDPFVCSQASSSNEGKKGGGRKATKSWCE